MQCDGIILIFLQSLINFISKSSLYTREPFLFSNQAATFIISYNIFPRPQYFFKKLLTNPALFDIIFPCARIQIYI